MICNVLYVLIYVRYFSGPLYSNTNPTETLSLFSIFPEESNAAHVLFKKINNVATLNYLQDPLSCGNVKSGVAEKYMKVVQYVYFDVHSRSEITSLISYELLTDEVRSVSVNYDFCR